MPYQSKLQEKSKNINIEFSEHCVKMLLLILIKEGMFRVKSNTI
ncbi:hypothetical protein QUQ_3418 [Clostridioides difficile P68]|nr:hypothetical protein QKC_3510 [Clostridioides difficile DA00167]EQK73541.1 hypothetical protein QEE_3646 [Clostridioides difficile CD113]ERM41248.1 hypothetical protein QUQ_3418 [Clostridioides difficile P68]